MYAHLQSYQDVTEQTLNQIKHFFEHYKDLEKGKWVKVEGWHGVEEAKAEIMAGLAAYKAD
jgi:inorganic pyrophosphatase